jgi:hypothetical protein
MQQFDIFADSLPFQPANTLAYFDRTIRWPALHALSTVDPDHAGLARRRVLRELLTN